MFAENEHFLKEQYFRKVSIYDYNVRTMGLTLNQYTHFLRALRSLVRCSEYVHLFKQVFQVKKLVGLPPQLELLAVIICKSGHNNMSKQFNQVQKVCTHTV